MKNYINNTFVKEQGVSMTTEKKNELFRFIHNKLGDYEGSPDLAWEVIFQQVDNNFTSMQKLAALKFIALHSSRSSSQRKQDALEVIRDRMNGGISIHSIDINLLNQ